MAKNTDRIMAALLKKTPHPKCELDYTNDYTFLVAILLSAQATDKSVNKATAPLFVKIAAPAEMLALGEEALKGFIRTVGLYNTKAKNIIKLSQILIDKYQGKVPADFEKLQELPGIGRKTAMVFLNSAYGYPLIGVDTHVFRVANRLQLAVGNSVLAVEKLLAKNIPAKYKAVAGHLLVLHGRYTCLAQRPKCGECVVAEFCSFFKRRKL